MFHVKCFPPFYFHQGAARIFLSTRTLSTPRVSFSILTARSAHLFFKREARNLREVSEIVFSLFFLMLAAPSSPHYPTVPRSDKTPPCASVPDSTSVQP